MIKVNNVSMKFNLGIEKNFSLKQFFIDVLSRKKKEKNEFWALSDVNFEVKKGEVVGFVGSNGAGKSTLLKVIAGVMKPTSGNIEVYGNICPMIELGAGFDMELTARENIFLNGAVMGYSKEFIEAKFDEIVEFSELKDFLNTIEQIELHKQSNEYQRSLMTDSLRYDILKRDGFRCVLCGATPEEDGIKLHVDHIIPVSKGGKTTKKNLRTLCDRCNLGKRDKYDSDGLN